MARGALVQMQDGGPILSDSGGSSTFDPVESALVYGSEPLDPRAFQPSPASQQLTQTGRELIQSAGSPLQRMQEFRQASDAAAEAKLAAIDRAMSVLQASGANAPGATNLPLLAAAAGMLSPTRTGRFSESLGAGARSAIPLVEQQRAIDRANALATGQLGVEAATVPWDQARQQEQDFLTRLQLGERYEQPAIALDRARMLAGARLGSKLGVTQLTPAALDSAAMDYIQTGVVPAKLDPATIMNRAAELKQQGKGGAQPGADVHGDDYLATLDPQIATQVKALAEGRMQFPSSFALSKPYWQQMLQKVGQYDPTFDAVNYNTRSKTRADFAMGQSAKNLTAINTALGHASNLYDAFDKLGNTGIPAINAPMNWWKENISGDQSITNAREAVSALAAESRKVFAATGGGSLEELRQWEKNFPINGSPDQQKGALKQLVELYDSRINALTEQYNRGLGRSEDPLNLLNPASRESYLKLTGQQPKTPTISGQGKGPIPPKEVPATSEFYIPPALRGIKDLQVSPSTGMLRDPATGIVYDTTGKPVEPAKGQP